MYASNHAEVSSNAITLDVFTADHAVNVQILYRYITDLSVEMK